ncbi:MAG: EamA family transporter [Myxococcota bacterium]|nr:EamA family transporter [Myxococcota bacterium]
MLHWLPLAGLIAIALGGYHVLLKLSSTHIDQVLGAVVLQLVAAVLGGSVLAAAVCRGQAPEITPRGVGLAAAAGLCVGAAEILSFWLFSAGVPASRGVPVVVGGSILVAALLGVLALREPLGLTQWLGVGLIVAGVAVLGR